MDTTDGIDAGKGLSCKDAIFYTAQGRCALQAEDYAGSGAGGTGRKPVKVLQDRRICIREGGRLWEGRTGGHRGVKEG